MPPIAARGHEHRRQQSARRAGPRESSNATALQSATRIRSFRAKLLFRISPIVSYPTPSTRGTKNPMIPRASAPIAGCQSSGIGKMIEYILDQIQSLRKNNRRNAAQYAQDEVIRQGAGIFRNPLAILKHAPVAHQELANATSPAWSRSPGERMNALEIQKAEVRSPG